MLSHQTAAELNGLVDSDSTPIHVTIPQSRRIKQCLEGVVVHRSRHSGLTRQSNRTPPRTRIEDTVLDLVAAAKSLDDATGWIAAACGRRLTTASRLRTAVAARARMRHRHEVLAALDDVESGCHSLLELRYLRDVERAHRLPTAKRQVRHRRDGGYIYNDAHYTDYGLVIELDGGVAHPIESRRHDHRRDNVAAERGDSVLHFGWSSVTDWPCEVATRVAAALRRRGWAGTPRRCRRAPCTIGDLSESHRLGTVPNPETSGGEAG
jgi:very-short-patch-repair endonuclease